MKAVQKDNKTMKNILKNIKNHRLLFLITLAFFALGLINIHFSLIGILCMIVPIVLLFKNRKKTWCQGYCPRAGLYSVTGRVKSWKSRGTPEFFIRGKMKWLMLIYFGVSLFIITMSTLGVARGIRPPMEYLRFFIFIPIPFEIPQLLRISEQIPWITHLSYRFYSMMMTTTILGLILALVYKPRTWCTICPISTVSDVILKK